MRRILDTEILLLPNFLFALPDHHVLKTKTANHVSFEKRNRDSVLMPAKFVGFCLKRFFLASFSAGGRHKPNLERGSVQLRGQRGVGADRREDSTSREYLRVLPGAVP